MFLFNVFDEFPGSEQIIFLPTQVIDAEYQYLTLNICLFVWSEVTRSLEIQNMNKANIILQESYMIASLNRAAYSTADWESNNHTLAA